MKTFKSFFKATIYKRNYYFFAEHFQSVYNWLIKKGVADCEIKNITALKRTPQKTAREI